MAFVRLILLLGICVTGFVTIECQDCSNAAGYCYYIYTYYYLDCYINNNETQYIKEVSISQKPFIRNNTILLILKVDASISVRLYT